LRTALTVQSSVTYVGYAFSCIHHSGLGGS
jgi:hypothetical protein